MEGGDVVGTHSHLYALPILIKFQTRTVRHCSRGASTLELFCFSFVACVPSRCLLPCVCVFVCEREAVCDKESIRSRGKAPSPAVWTLLTVETSLKAS